MKKFLHNSLILVLILISGVFCVACSSKQTKDKQFTCEDLTITLTNKFEDMSDLDNKFRFIASDSSIAVYADYQFLEDSKDNITAEKFARSVIENPINNISFDTPVMSATEYGFVYFEYEKESSGIEFKFFATVHKTTTKFWLCQFSAIKSRYDDLRPTMIKYAQSITVGD